jgi:hypothetical protein
MLLGLVNLSQLLMQAVVLPDIRQWRLGNSAYCRHWLAFTSIASHHGAVRMVRYSPAVIVFEQNNINQC